MGTGEGTGIVVEGVKREETGEGGGGRELGAGEGEGVVIGCMS